MVSRRVFLASLASAAGTGSLFAGVSSSLAIGTGYDFFRDCHGGPQDPRLSSTDAAILGDEIKPFFVYEALELILAIADTYSIVKSDVGSSDQMLNDVYDQLNDIRYKLSVVNDKIDDVLFMLKELPAIVRGEVEDALVKEALGECNALVGDIQDKMKPKLVDQYIEQIEADCRDLTVKLGGISGLRGMGGVVVSAPYLAAWLPAVVATQKARKRKDSNWVIDSPWNRTFMGKNKAMLDDLMQQFEAYDSQVPGIVAKIPNHRDRYNLVGVQFVPTQPFGEYLFSCPDSSDGNERLKRWNHDVVHPEWRVVTGGPGMDAYRTMDVQRQQISMFYAAAPQVYAAKDTLAAAFIEPPGIWDIIT